jgi:hypothetical protein
VTAKSATAWLVVRAADVLLALLWVWSVRSVYNSWGVWPVAIGAAVYGVGIIPLAAILFLSKLRWISFGALVLGAATVFGLRAISSRIRGS